MKSLCTEAMLHGVHMCHVLPRDKGRTSACQKLHVVDARYLELGCAPLRYNLGGEDRFVSDREMQTFFGLASFVLAFGG